MSTGRSNSPLRSRVVDIGGKGRVRGPVPTLGRGRDRGLGSGVPGSFSEDEGGVPSSVPSRRSGVSRPPPTRARKDERIPTPLSSHDSGSGSVGFYRGEIGERSGNPLDPGRGLN